MATISKNTIIGKGFDIGLAVPTALGLSDGNDGSFIIAAHQIAWGNNSVFNAKSFGNTTEELLSAIESAISNKKSELLNNVTGITVLPYSNELEWNKATKIANINGIDITVKLPSKPTDADSKVTSVTNHYSNKEITTAGLYKIKTDAAGHITEATALGDYFIEKSKMEALRDELVILKNKFLLNNGSSTPTVTPTVTPTGDSSVSPTPTPKPDTTTPTVTPVGGDTSGTQTEPTTPTTTSHVSTITTTAEPTTTPATTSSTTSTLDPDFVLDENGMVQVDTWECTECGHTYTRSEGKNGNPSQCPICGGKGVSTNDYFTATSTSQK